MFWYIKEAIDAYFDGRPFQVTVNAGCIVGKKQDAARTTDRELDDGLIEAARIDEDEIDTGLPLPPHQIAAGSVRVGEEIDVSEHDVIDEDSPEEHDLDAFIEGRKRPSHLDD